MTGRRIAGEKLSEFRLAGASSATHGTVRFHVANSGGVEHELVVIRTSRKASKLSTSSTGKASEKGEDFTVK